MDTQTSRDARAIAITRLAVSVVTIANLILAQMGWNPLELDDETVYMGVSGILALCAAVWAWWKNNNVTKAAQVAQIVLNAEKAETPIIQVPQVKECAFQFPKIGGTE